jgi:hypothetical protein
MNVAEGTRRIRQAGKWIFLLAATTLILLYAMSMILKNGLPGFSALSQIALVGVALWVAGWIVEGFARTN